MKSSRTVFTLSASLAGVLLAGWLIAHLQSNPKPALAPPPDQEAASPIPVAEAVVDATPQREPMREVRAELPQPTPEIQPTGEDLALTSTNSPINSQDLDQNRDWAREFPDQALTWLQTAPDGPQRETIAEMVCANLAQTNAVKALALAERYLGGSTNGVMQNALENIAQQWAGQDTQAASAWALAKPPGEGRDRLLGRVAFVQSQTNPEEAARLVAGQMSSETYHQRDAAISVIHQWAKQDPAAAMAWAESLPQDLRQRAIVEVNTVSAHAQENPPSP
jgi:hypothetical protein